MINGRKLLAIVPARGGSKRLPRKNILEMNGKPLISHTIEAALACEYIDNVVVTSDSTEILDIASSYVGVTSHVRDKHLATDTATTVDCVLDVVAKYMDYEYFVLLQPTSPLRKTKHICGAVDLLVELNAESIVSVCECEHSPLWANKIPDNLSMNGFLPESIQNKRSQDIPKYYRLNGAIYLIKRNILTKLNKLVSDESYAYIMEQESSIDIDSKYDFICASELMKTI